MYLLVSTLHSILFSSVRPSSFSGGIFFAYVRDQIDSAESPLLDALLLLLYLYLQPALCTFLPSTVSQVISNSPG